MYIVSLSIKQKQINTPNFSFLKINRYEIAGVSEFNYLVERLQMVYRCPWNVDMRNGCKGS